MKLWLRMLWFFSRLRFGSPTPLTPTDVSRVRFRVWPSDLDVLGHMNNGVYLTLMDLGRVDLMERAGIWRRLKRAGVYPVVAASTITYRKSLDPWTTFTLETKFAGVDERSVYIEQRFTVDGEVYARAWVRGRFLRTRRDAGPVTHAHLSELFGFDVETLPASDDLMTWGAATALPSPRTPTPSVW